MGSENFSWLQSSTPISLLWAGGGGGAVCLRHSWAVLTPLAKALFPSRTGDTCAHVGFKDSSFTKLALPTFFKVDTFFI